MLGNKSLEKSSVLFSGTPLCIAENMERGILHENEKTI